MNKLIGVLEYWFGDSPDDLQVIREQGRLWFGKDEQVDATIRERFAPLVEEVGCSPMGSDSGSAAEHLAKIILLDQFPRNIFRGSARAFAFDRLALSLTLRGLEQGVDRRLRPVERVFFYLPLEHSERLDDQDLSVALFSRLAEGVPETWKSAFAGFLDYARRHQTIIARFGRFPHRNAILGRTSTAEERNFLTEPGSSF